MTEPVCFDIGLPDHAGVNSHKHCKNYIEAHKELCSRQVNTFDAIIALNSASQGQRPNCRNKHGEMIEVARHETV